VVQRRSSVAIFLVVVGFASATALTSPASAANRVVNVPSRVVHNCSRDVTRALTKFFASVPDGSTVRLPNNGCFRVDQTVTIQGKSGLTIEGRGSRLVRSVATPKALQYPHQNPVLRLVTVSHTVLENLNIRGQNTKPDVSYLPPGYGAWDPRYAFDHGIALEGVSDVVIRDATIDAVYGDGIYISGHDQWTHSPSDGVTIDRVAIDRNGRQGISVSRSSNVVIDAVDIQHSRRSGIDLEPDTVSEVISNVEIENSRVGSWLLAFASGGPGTVSHIYIHNNVVTRSGTPWVYDVSTEGTARSDWRVADNMVQSTLGSPQPAMRFAHTSGVVISGNRVPVATTQARLEVGLANQTTNVRIRCNEFPGAATQYVTSDASSSYLAANNSLNYSAPPSC
jgi:hypothetical protein